jgi:hypothetical protein
MDAFLYFLISMSGITVLIELYFSRIKVAGCAGCFKELAAPGFFDQVFIVMWRRFFRAKPYPGA